MKIHQKYCLNKYCGCKIIEISSVKSENKVFELDDNLKKINYFIESKLIKYDFHNNFELAYLLSEHFYINKKNTTMAYSLLQTLLHFNYRSLSKEELILIYCALNKYINNIMEEKIKKFNLNKYNNNSNEIMEYNKENELKQYFNAILKIKKVEKLMKNYAICFREIINYKQNYENSIQIDIDERDGEIEKIYSGILTRDFISELMKFLKEENDQTNDIRKYVYDLKEYNKILTYEFLYKCFLFIDYFWNATIPNELIEILFAFSTDRNLYAKDINKKIYTLLEENYKENYKIQGHKYYLLLKYTKGLLITYISETLTRKLQLLKKDIM